MKHKRIRKSTLHKSSTRQIRNSFGRFFAIFGIIALGVGFFAGVRITSPDLLRTVGDYYASHTLFDLRLLSSLGWEKEDVSAFQKAEGVAYAEGSCQYDIICSDAQGLDIVIKAHAITDNINLPDLKEGRLPQSADEILMDNFNRNGFHLGDTLTLSPANAEEDLEHFSYTSYKIVGFTDSPIYINFERGGTFLGDGTVSGFVLIPKEGFADDYYSEIYVSLTGNEALYSDAYEEKIDAARERFETLAEAQADRRYRTLKEDADNELADAKEEFAEKKADGEKELADAREELDDAKQELSDAEKELSDGEDEIRKNEKKLSDGEQKIRDSEKELADGKKALEDAKGQLIDGQRQLNDAEKMLAANKSKLDAAEKKLAAGKKQLDASEKQLAAGKTALTQAAAQLSASLSQIESGEAAIAANRQQLEGAYAAKLIDEATYSASLSALAAQEAALSSARAQYQQGLASYQANLASYQAGEVQYQQGLSSYNESLAEVNAGKAALAQGQADLEKAKAGYQEGLGAYNRALQEYLDGEKKLADAKKELADGKRKLNDGKKELADGRREYEDGKAEYEDGLAEYEDGKAEFDEKITDAEEKIRDAEDEIGELKEPDTYVLDRGSNIAYTCFESDSDIVAQVARVFPIFFILVAALVCMTTMTRMVEEERTGIGVLKALGYTSADIMGKFSFYSGSAAVLGCIVGYSIGIFLFPYVIWYAYRMMYIDLPLHYLISPAFAAGSLAVSLLCCVGTTYLACRFELTETAASLMRPKAPKPGKRIFLEYLPFIWNRMKFLRKVSFRNIFRYKRRFFMMIVGISGSAALLLTGLGMKDSIAGFAGDQYDTIQVSDAEVTFKNGTKKEIPPSLLEALENEAESYTLFASASRDLVLPKVRKNINLLVPKDPEAFAGFFRLFDAKDHEKNLPMPNKGQALVCISLAERYDLKEGDVITIEDDDLKAVKLTVSGIFENHVYNYVIANEEDFSLSLSSAYVTFPEGSDPFKAQTRIADNKNVTYVNLFEDFRKRMTNMMESLNLVVFVVILSAAGLSFIVLYNLTNINITERLREIATIKVLGFYPGETAQYVFRENMALTLIGAGAGMILGIWLHRFVMKQIVVDMVHFRVFIEPKSYGIAVVLTFVFTILVDLFMSTKLERINMAEALKSVE